MKFLDKVLDQVSETTIHGIHLRFNSSFSGPFPTNEGYDTFFLLTKLDRQTTKSEVGSGLRY